MTATSKDANGSISLIDASVPLGGGPVAHVRATKPAREISSSSRISTRPRPVRLPDTDADFGRWVGAALRCRYGPSRCQILCCRTEGLRLWTAACGSAELLSLGPWLSKGAWARYLLGESAVERSRARPAVAFPELPLIPLA
jgi:hypothetical protein